MAIGILREIGKVKSKSRKKNKTELFLSKELKLCMPYVRAWGEAVWAGTGEIKGAETWHLD